MVGRRILATLALGVTAAALAGSAVAASSWYRWNANVSYQWVVHPSCSYYDSCWQIDVKARRGCPNGLYVSINILKSKRVVGYTNDALDSLTPNQVGRLTLGTSETGTVSGHLTKIDCY
jgi:hypothetical protein